MLVNKVPVASFQNMMGQLFKSDIKSLFVTLRCLANLRKQSFIAHSFDAKSTDRSILSHLKDLLCEPHLKTDLANTSIVHDLASFIPITDTEVQL